MIELPIRTVNPTNAREHWAKKAKRTKQERLLAYCATPKVSMPAHVKLTRLGPRKLDDDNLAASFKAIRDGIADKLGVDDGCDLIRFEYAQRKGKVYGIEIEFLRDSGAR